MKQIERLELNVKLDIDEVVAAAKAYVNLASIPLNSC
jgi:hypothetical protein